MKRHLTLAVCVLVVAALVLPGAALAAGNGKGKGSEKSRGERPAAAQKNKGADKAKGADKKAQNAERKAERERVRAAAKTERAQKRAELAVAADSEGDGTESAVDASSTPWPERPVDRAFASITTNLERSVAKVEAGKKSQLPPGLVRVWLKFASWLGVDPTLMPAIPVAPPEDPMGEPTSTVEPTGTVAPDPMDPVAPPVDETGMPVE